MDVTLAGPPRVRRVIHLHAAATSLCEAEDEICTAPREWVARRQYEPSYDVSRGNAAGFKESSWWSKQAQVMPPSNNRRPHCGVVGVTAPRGTAASVFFQCSCTQSESEQPARCRSSRRAAAEAGQINVSRSRGCGINKRPSRQ